MNSGNGMFRGEGSRGTFERGKRREREERGSGRGRSQSWMTDEHSKRKKRGSEGSGGMEKACSQLLRRVTQFSKDSNGTTMVNEIRSDLRLWNKCWKDCKDSATALNLVSVLSRIPPAEKLRPPSLDVCLRVSGLCLNDLEDEDVSKTVAIVLDFIGRLLQFEWKETEEQVRSGLLDLIKLTSKEMSSLLMLDGDKHQELQARLKERLKEVKTPGKILRPATCNDTDGEMNEGNPHDIEHPSIGWLLEGKNFVPGKLPVLQTAKVLLSKEAYLQATWEVYVGLTFNDGHQALTPRCSRFVVEQKSHYGLELNISSQSTHHVLPQGKL